LYTANLVRGISIITDKSGKNHDELILPLESIETIDIQYIIIYIVIKYIINLNNNLFFEREIPRRTFFFNREDGFSDSFKYP